MGNIKTALSSSISAVFFADFVTSGYTLLARIYTENTLLLTLQGEGIFSVVFFQRLVQPFLQDFQFFGFPRTRYYHCIINCCVTIISLLGTSVFFTSMYSTSMLISNKNR